LPCRTGYLGVQRDGNTTLIENRITRSLFAAASLIRDPFVPFFRATTEGLRISIAKVKKGIFDGLKMLRSGARERLQK